MTKSNSEFGGTSAIQHTENHPEKSDKMSTMWEINKRSLRDKLYYASKDGYAICLVLLLNEIDEKLRSRIVNEVNQCQGLRPFIDLDRRKRFI